MQGYRSGLAGTVAHTPPNRPRVSVRVRVRVRVRVSVS